MAEYDENEIDEQKQENEDEKVAECKYIFGLYDTNNDGLVTVSEAQEILRTTGVYPTQSDMAYLFSKVNPSGKGQLNLEQILEMLNLQLEHPDTEESIIESFKVFDRDGKGVIKVDEFRSALEAFEEDLTKTKINDMIKAADPGKKGEIRYKDFVKKMLNV